MCKDSEREFCEGHKAHRETFVLKTQQRVEKVGIGLVATTIRAPKAPRIAMFGAQSGAKVGTEVVFQRAGKLSANSTNSFRIHWRVLSYRTDQRELGTEVPEIDKLERLAQKASA